MLRVTVSAVVMVLISALLLGGLSCSQGEQRQQKTELERLLRQAEAALAANPGDNDARYQRADILSQLQRYAESKEECDSLIDNDSTYAMAFFLRGFVISQLNPPGADTLKLRDYRRSAQLDPTHAPSFYNIGNVYLGWEIWDSAIAYSSRAIVLDSLDTLAYHNRSLAYRRKNILDSMLMDVDNVLRLDRQFARAYHLRSYAHFKKGDLNEAIADINRCIELSGEKVEATARFDRGQYLLQLGDIDSAVLEWNRTVELDSNFFRAHFNLARTYDQWNQNGKAVDHYRAYLKSCVEDTSMFAFVRERIVALEQ